MKKKTIMGTDVPVTGADTGSENNSLWDILLPEECRIKSRSDYFYVTALFFLVAGFLFPPFLIGAVACVLLAKKGGRK